MPEIKWDKTGERTYRTGTKNGVLYLFNSTSKEYDTAVAWNGLTGVTLSPEGAEANDVYADDIKYLSLYSAEKLGFTIEALDAPDEFDECDGIATLAAGAKIGQQSRKMFGFSYVTTLGNDIDGNDYGYEIHLLYGCKASPSEQSFETINDSPEPTTMSWECTTDMVNVTGHKPTSHIVINSKTANETKLANLKKILYGTDADTEAGTTDTVGRLPLPDEVASILAQG